MWWLAALIVWAPAQQPDPAQRGLKALEEQRYEEAARLFAQAVQADPGDYAALFHLALAQSLMGGNEEAIANYRRVLELKPGLYEAELNLGILLVRSGRAREALPHLEAAAGRKPGQPRAYSHWGMALLEAGEYGEARRKFDKALELDPASPLAHLGLARTLLRLDHVAEAEKHFRQAAALDASLREALRELAAALESKGERERAIALYREFPEDPAMRERLGHLLLEAGRAAEAVPHLEWAVAKSPTVANRTALAIARARSGEAERALEELRQTLAAYPEEAELHLLYGRVLRDQKRFAEAAGEFSRYVRMRPDSTEGWSELAAMLVSLEQYPQALAALDRVRARGAETAGHHYLRAIILDRLKDYKGAIAAYEAFLAASHGRFPDEEFKARQRLRIIRKEAEHR